MKSVAVSQCLCHLFDHSDVILRCHHWCVSVQNVWALLMKWVGRLRPTKTRGRSRESMEVPQHKQVTHTLLLCCSSLYCGLDPVFQPGPTRSEGVRRKRGEDRVQHLWRGGGGCNNKQQMKGAVESRKTGLSDPDSDPLKFQGRQLDWLEVLQNLIKFEMTQWTYFHTDILSVGQTTDETVAV